MQLSIFLYKNLSENKDVDKNLTEEKKRVGETRQAFSILEPVVIVDDIEPNAYNYCYVVELRRYYYITSSTFHPNGLCTLNLKVDVLMSFKADIRASTALIMKQRNYNPYFGEFDVEARTEATRYDFEDRFDHTGEFVLVALKG